MGSQQGSPGSKGGSQHMQSDASRQSSKRPQQGGSNQTGSQQQAGHDSSRDNDYTSER